MSIVLNLFHNLASSRSTVGDLSLVSDVTCTFALLHHSQEWWPTPGLWPCRLLSCGRVWKENYRWRYRWRCHQSVEGGGGGRLVNLYSSLVKKLFWGCCVLAVVWVLMVVVRVRPAFLAGLAVLPRPDRRTGVFHSRRWGDRVGWSRITGGSASFYHHHEDERSRKATPPVATTPCRLRRRHTVMLW